MKKSFLAGAILLLPLCLFAGCGGGIPTLAVSANWYANINTTDLDYTAEKLTYDVDFTPPSVAEDFSVEYDKGTYTTELSYENHPFEDGTKAYVYLYKTRLDITGRYTYQGTTGETFTDFVESTVYFHPVSRNLLPIESTKEIHSTNPAASPSATHLSDTVHIVYSVKYSTAAAADAPLNKATVTLQNKGDEEAEPPTPTEIDINVSGSFFDNEQILFAMRGLDMTASVTFSTLDPQTSTVTGVKFTDTPAASPYTPQALTIQNKGEVTEAINAYSAKFLYNVAQSGPERTAYYAARTAADNNVYRNVLLRLEDPIPSGYGSLVYTLKNAEFAEKSANAS